MKKIFTLSTLFFLILGSIIQLSAQSFPNNNFSSTSNKFYWKNKAPFPGYWQQDVHYKINADLDDRTRVLNCSEELTYSNNSPDTLTFVYFHLYQNAFQPGSYSDALYKANGVKPYYGQYERLGLNTTVNDMKVDGQAVKTELDNTIMKVYLNKPLLPGASIQFTMNFKSYFDGGTVRRRMKIFIHNGYLHFDCVHWYPRIAVYDRKGGWNTDQHLGREFYGDYGSFDVSLKIPSNYILQGTGDIINENEVLPADLKSKIDIRNFKNKPLNEKPSEIIKPDGSKKTWLFHAENVHDFAWSADPTYRMSEISWKGVRCIALAQEEVAGKWQNADTFIAHVIETYSRDFGMYDWPKIVVCDARDGMEYPMITLCGGTDPDYDYVISHEVGHEWFFGMLGNNETYRAFMDEGFTQFLTAWGITSIDGPYGKDVPIANKYIKRFSKHNTSLQDRVLLPYISTADNEDNLSINTHSDYFNGAIGHGGGYGAVYYRGATMLYQLQYVLGDSLFLKAMQHYVAQWKFCHPYPEDFRNSIIQFTHINLNWFFDEWIETNKYIDYGIKHVKYKGNGAYAITFIRKGSMQMPLDFTVITQDGKRQTYFIPNSYFSKNGNATVLKPWIGWNNLYPTYTAEIMLPGKIKNIIIDTTQRLADINLLDNQWKGTQKVYFDASIYRTADRRYYEWYARPDLWYNSVDGLKIGLHMHGNYLNKSYFTELGIWYNSGLLASPDYKKIQPSHTPVSFNYAYQTALKKWDKDLNIFTNIKLLDGLQYYKLGFGKTLKNNSYATLDYRAMIRPTATDLNYLLYPTQWMSDKWNNTFNAGITHSYNVYNGGNGKLSFKLRTTGPGSDYNYSSLIAEETHTIGLKKFVLKGRATAEWIGGSNIAPESQLYLAGGNPEDMMENKFLRSRAIIPTDWLGYGNTINHFQYGGGLNMRGYSGYVAPSGSDTSQRYTYAGRVGAAVNAEVDFTRYIPIKIQNKFLNRYFSINTYLFGDAGFINNNRSFEKLTMDNIKSDAGLGATLTIKSWYPLQKLQALVLRFDMPFFVSNAPYADNGQNFKFRWVAGIGTAF